MEELKPNQILPTDLRVSSSYLAKERETGKLSSLNVTTGGHVHGHGPGTLPDHVYDASMNWVRAGIRRVLVRNLKKESRLIGAMQKRIRTPWLDTFFVYTSSLGTHTFFMTLLPAFFFFGYPELGRGLVHVLAAGVYFTSLIKDLICSPRPFAPPVTRLTMGSHHLEYGFPSTHSTNSVSIALYLYSLVYNLRYTFVEEGKSALSPWAFTLWTVFSVLYAVSITFGRVYCAMHSITDCVFGVILGAAIAGVQWAYGEMFEEWMRTPGWAVPLIVLPLITILVNRHAEPVDDCPCFEGAIAFVSVVCGSILSVWHASRWGLDIQDGYYTSRMPGSNGNDLGDWALWLTFAALKMIIGVAIIFIWRLVAKYTFHTVLPPLFRGLSRLFTLPTRRFYTPATDYDGPVPEDSGLRPIPSVIDIPGMMRSQDGGASTALPSYVLGNLGEKNGGVSFRSGKSTPPGSLSVDGYNSPSARSVADEEEHDEDDEVKKHYDADVLTKVFVYAGIGFIATGTIPQLFEWLGWGVLPASRLV